MDGEYIVIAGWPVQFLPAACPLVEEALAQTVEKDVAGTPAHVFTAEHLAAIALQTGRAKGKARLLQPRGPTHWRKAGHARCVARMRLLAIRPARPATETGALRARSQ